MAAEEDEEEMWDSWEDVADSGELERRMEERDKKFREKDQKPSTTIPKSLDSKSNATILMQEDTNRTLYKPQLRILKRQPDPGGRPNQGSNPAGTKDKPVHKTLAERQAQYAEARARILGSASDECSSPEDPTPKLVQVEQKLPENVTRLPRGPTGSKGFEVAR